jgi:DNA modification methylase
MDKIQLFKGDCLEIMKDIPSGSVDAIITDPPYGTTACKWDSVIDFGLMWEQLNRIIKPNGAIVLFGSEPFSSALRMSNIKNYKYDWVWEKTKGTGHLQAKKRPMVAHELIHVFYKKQSLYKPQKTKGKPYSTNKRNTNKDGVYGVVGSLRNGNKDGLYYPRSVLKFSREHKPTHPTQKPVALIEYLIKTYTNENETVLDFTMGSGTTGVACLNTNRNFIGIEMDDKYFEIAQKRIKDHSAQLKLF